MPLSGETNLDGNTDTLDGGTFDWGDSALEAMRDFIAGYPHADALGALAIDYADRVPGCVGLFPGGLVEVRRTTDLIGNVTVDNQYNFALYTVMSKAPGDDAKATDNAEVQMDFQTWVQERSALGLAPTFGDEPRKERMTASNGAIYSADDEGTAIYVIHIQATFRRHFRKE